MVIVIIGSRIGEVQSATESDHHVVGLIAQLHHEGYDDAGGTLSRAFYYICLSHSCYDALHTLRRKLCHLAVGVSAAQQTEVLTHSGMIYTGGRKDDARVGQRDVNEGVVPLHVPLREGGEINISLESDIYGDGYLAVTQVERLFIGVAEELSLEPNQVVMRHHLVYAVFGCIETALGTQAQHGIRAIDPNRVGRTAACDVLEGTVPETANGHKHHKHNKCQIDKCSLHKYCKVSENISEAAQSEDFFILPDWEKASAHYPTAVFEAKKNMLGGVTSVGECVGGDCFFS